MYNAIYIVTWEKWIKQLHDCYNMIVSFSCSARIVWRLVQWRLLCLIYFGDGTKRVYKNINYFFEGKIDKIKVKRKLVTSVVS